MNNDVNEIIMGVYNGYFFTRNLPESSDYTESEQNIEKWLNFLNLFAVAHKFFNLFAIMNKSRGEG